MFPIVFVKIGAWPFGFVFEAMLSDLCVFFALTGIFPDTYRAAPPRPGFEAGNLFAMTVVDLGMIVVSSS